jgi:indole-3-glycerol phosphate synthase
MTILEQIVAAKRHEIATAKTNQTELQLRQQLQLGSLKPPRDFLAALRNPPTVQVIAEIKRASPSAGIFQAQPDILSLAQAYETHGAACISVLTDGPFFQGSLEDLRQVRQAVQLPLLRKDFILDTYQVVQARLAGADAVLLIAEILSDEEIRHLLTEIHAMGMTALVECYEPVNLSRVIAAGAKLIGINNRNLHTFITDLEHTCRLADQLPRDCVLVSESGIRTRTDVEKLASYGVQAILVGETLMRSGNVARTLPELCGVRKQA